MEINNTAGFQVALLNGELDQATAWFERAKLYAKYNDRWRDHRSRELIRELCIAGRFDEAEKYIVYARDEQGRQGRRDKIATAREAAS